MILWKSRLGASLFFHATRSRICWVLIFLSSVEEVDLIVPQYMDLMVFMDKEGIRSEDKAKLQYTYYEPYPFNTQLWPDWLRAGETGWHQDLWRSVIYIVHTMPVRRLNLLPSRFSGTHMWLGRSKKTDKLVFCSHWASPSQAPLSRCTVVA